MGSKQTPEITSLMLLTLFRQCSHLQYRLGHFHGQGRILILLRERGKMTQRELSAITQRRSATLSEQLENMEKAGLITRGKNSADKRNVDLFLTEKGRQMSFAAEKEREEVAAALYSVLDEQDKTKLYEILQKLNESWQDTTIIQPYIDEETI